jgi:TMEM175 potassium channel family protein
MNITTNRVEAFSDCVISIVMTIMVFGIKLPANANLTNKWEMKQLLLLAPQLISYLFSFAVLGIMWINHHHLLHLIQKADEKLLWLNLHLLFWLSLIPFPTDMLGRNPLLSYSTATYGAILFMASFAMTLLRGYAVRNSLMHIDSERTLNKTIDKVNRRARIKNYIGMASYLLSIPVSFWSVYVAYACFTVTPILFFIPDGIDDERLAEKVIAVNESASKSVPSNDIV